MTKNEHLSSDIDFIKEFEELRIKQKLLIESLKKKDFGEQSKILEQINTKLDFLVNLFKATKEVESDDLDIKIKAILDKITSLEEKINESNSQIKQLSEKGLPPTAEPEKTQAPEGQTAPLPPGTKTPPPPDFGIEKKEETAKSENEKKKGWFSK